MTHRRIALLVLLGAIAWPTAGMRASETPNGGSVPSPVWQLDLSPGASTWFAGIPTTDGELDQDHDSPDANYPDLYENKGTKFGAGEGPGGEDVITVDPSYGPDAPNSWIYVGTAWRLFGPLSGGKFAINTGRYVSRHYIDSNIQTAAESWFLRAFTLYSFGLFTAPLDVGLYDDSGSAVVEIDTSKYLGSDFVLSDPIAWSTFLNKWVEFDVRWRLSSDLLSANDGYVTVRLRTSTDGSTWTDLGIVADAQNVAIRAYEDDGAGTALGYGITQGYAGLPGKFYYAALYSSDVIAVTPTLPLNGTTECCGAGAVEGAGVPTPGAGVERAEPIDPTWIGRATGGGLLDTVSDLTDPEDFSDSV